MTAQSQKIKNIRLAALITAALPLLGVAMVRLGYLAPLPALPQVLCIQGCQPDPAIHPVSEGENYLNEGQALATLLPDRPDPAQTSILIEKGKNRLTLFYQDQPIKAYPVVFGDSPIGDKRREGDRKTPEGIFKIRDLYPHPDWARFIWLDYPNPTAWREHYRAKLTGQLNWFMPIGGQVGIHGVPAGQDAIIDQRTNWTWGCPSLKNADVIELYTVVQVGTVVEIIP